ncbi:putative heme protein [Candidatus Jettenia caeni]|uniref:Putative heme protein n=1 Tax=Candidatus Jettenia caeni TaxID=247490 RepID=I3IPP2_9BACT|nr:multiheme c-type cytochrome [Candidatus Jettenia sp. AMX1]WKZ16134.1 MAG: multiheme c-type cytochrome [Candidatus Jettenia caeni]GAB63687.1 putative heme protein [Candidatus Jettenia caeni]
MFCKPVKLLPKLLPVFFSAVGLLSSGCVIYPELVEKGMYAPKSERCGDCHKDIYNEWKNSPHARSFTNAEFKEETNTYQFTFCLGCHVPETIFTDKKIEPRSENLAEGVHCNSCHLNDCKLSGPTPAHGPHPIHEKNQFFRTSEMCGKCHIGTFLAWQKSDTIEEKKTCQDCHMPSIKRKLIQDDPWQKIYPKREGKQHLFSSQTLFDTHNTLLTMSFIKVIQCNGRIEGILELENTGTPHGIPTGDYGYREVVLTIELQDEAGRVEDLKKESFFVEMKTALQYREKRCIPFYFHYDGDSYAIKATIHRISFHKDTDILLAEVKYTS